MQFHLLSRQGQHSLGPDTNTLVCSLLPVLCPQHGISGQSHKDNPHRYSLPHMDRHRGCRHSVDRHTRIPRAGNFLAHVLHLHPDSICRGTENGALNPIKFYFITVTARLSGARMRTYRPESAYTFRHLSCLRISVQHYIPTVQSPFERLFMYTYFALEVHCIYRSEGL